MNELDAIYRAVVADPLDDTPRLVYADELEELADPFDPMAEAMRAHAALIRHQVEAYRMPFCDLCFGTGRYPSPSDRGNDGQDVPHGPQTFTIRYKYCDQCERGPLTKECTRLITSKVYDPAPGVTAKYAGTLGAYIVRRVPYAPDLEAADIRRGFVDAVSLPVVPFSCPRRKLFWKLVHALPLTRIGITNRRAYNRERDEAPPDGVPHMIHGFTSFPVAIGDTESEERYTRLPPYVLPANVYTAVKCVHHMARTAGIQDDDYSGETLLEWACVHMGRVMSQELPPVMPWVLRPSTVVLESEQVGWNYWQLASIVRTELAPGLLPPDFAHVGRNHDNEETEETA